MEDVELAVEAEGGDDERLLGAVCGPVRRIEADDDRPEARRGCLAELTRGEGPLASPARCPVCGRALGLSPRFVGQGVG